MQNGDVIERPPRTIMEVYKNLPEGTLAELIDGIIYMSPSPVRNHQRLVLDLATLINQFVKSHGLGEVFIAPFDVYLDEERNAVQPDIIFVSNNRGHIVKDHIHGVPDLLIELVSPGNTTHDTVKKKKLYEESGVREYWVIDPSSKNATGYSLINGKYTLMASDVGCMRSALLNSAFNF